MLEGTWQTRLMDRYPHIFIRVVGGRPIRSGYPVVGYRWRELVETAVRRIADAATFSFAGVVTITQVKENCGTLRLYPDIRRLPPGPTAKVEEAIDLAEARSACTCEVRGAAGRLYCDSDWYATRCEEHARGEAVLVRPGWDNLLVEQAYVNGRVRVVSCHRYDRDRDAFVDARLPRDLRGREG